jgi:hypothetical protein
MQAVDDLKKKFGDRLWLAHLDMTGTPEYKVQPTVFVAYQNSAPDTLFMEYSDPLKGR